MKKKLATILLFVFSGFLLSCSSSQEYTSTESPRETFSSNYTTSFPNRDISDLLNDARNSILRIVSTGYYHSFSFEKKFITLADIKTNKPADIATRRYSTEQSTAGTSIVLETNPDDALVITCDHIVSFPDTVITYYNEPNLPSDTYIKNISIKNRQVDLIFGPREFRNFKLIASDPQNDLALLTTRIVRHNEFDELLRNFDMGEADNLQMGSFLYIIGFPKGYPMITRGIASTSGDWDDRFFVADALFNPGVSGGLVIASNDNFRTMQWIGMAKSATATEEAILVPRQTTERYGKAIQPYRDSIFVQEKTRISYGITQAIPINKIRTFLEENRRTIHQNGFDIPSFSN